MAKYIACRGLGDLLVALPPFRWLSDGTRDDFKNFANTFGSACLWANGGYVDCAKNTAPAKDSGDDDVSGDKEAKRCCKFDKVGISYSGLSHFRITLDLEFDLGKMGKMSSAATKAAKGATTAAGLVQVSIAFDIKITALAEKGYITDFRCPAHCGADRVSAELWLHLDGSYTPTVAVPLLGLKVDEAVSVTGDYAIGDVQITCEAKWV